MEQDAVARAVPGMLTDLYQLTMANAYRESGVAETEACFHLYFRSNPFDGGYSIACGLAQALEYLEQLSFSADDVAYLATLTGTDGTPLFGQGFLDWLREFRFDGDVLAVPEGTVVFPGEPLLRVSGPIATCQIVETALLNIINFQTLVATKAARVVMAADGDPVLEFGLRRAQGPDGGLSAGRAAYIGGCAGTSNVLTGQRYGVPIGGTHAHSLVMLFDTELEAFIAYAEAMPNNAVLLVDTYDTLEGVRNAVTAGRRLRELGSDLAGIRIDSGDLAWLSLRARELLDAAGFEATRIYASNELDEYTIESLKEQGARIDVWGVGTKLVTAYDQPALGGVYKLSAVREPGGVWEPRVKVSEQAAKVTTPGLQQIRRFVDDDGRFVGDMVYDELEPPDSQCVMVDPADATRRTSYCPTNASEELLVPVCAGGRVIYDVPPIDASRGRTREQLSRLDPSHQRLLNPHTYKVGMELGLYERKTALILAARGFASDQGGR
ncbi:MAG: nicotinate phosphoribosyltransferase [Coriobacteriia bacterium]|nr:nicotinate phosphoribosyltransferase [Coriobacteriia bacterium]MBN2847939.1 nicotinate phosphoribosyltransferase [Coriobacteriia bacterium]